MVSAMTAILCPRCNATVTDGRGGCRGAQHGNHGCAMNHPNGPPRLPVEHGIPLPPAGRGRGHQRTRRFLMPWDDLAIGDSFLAPISQHQAAAHVAQARRTRPERNYTTRAVDGGTRIWRTA
jgi:hypothetical protein